MTGFNQCAPFVGKSPLWTPPATIFCISWNWTLRGTHIALGGDLDGATRCRRASRGYKLPVSCKPAIGAGEGRKKKTLHGIFWDNALNVLERAGN